MTRRYFDNAATSFPKPPVMLDAMVQYQTELGASPGRGAYREAVESGRLLTRCRERLNTLIGGADPDHIIFTLNTSDALNLAIRGLLGPMIRRGESVHVVTSWMDHNSILRPLHALESVGVRTTYVPCDPVTGQLNPADVRAAITDHTRLVATIHGSNVTGTLQPVADLGAICRAAGVPFLVDAAQTVGHLPVDVDAMQIDLLAFPGHKGLLGPSGTGGLAIRPEVAERMEPVREGGTGSASEEPVQPKQLPDRFEPGSHNALGLIGLSASVQWILDRGVDTLWAHEQSLIERMLDGLDGLPGLRVLGPPRGTPRCGVFAVVHDTYDPHALAGILEQSFGILCRAGIHCAPLAHQTLGTTPTGGATRLSLGPFLTNDDVDACLDAFRNISSAPSTPSTTATPATPKSTPSAESISS